MAWEWCVDDGEGVDGRLMVALDRNGDVDETGALRQIRKGWLIHYGRLVVG